MYKCEILTILSHNEETGSCFYIAGVEFYEVKLFCPRNCPTGVMISQKSDKDPNVGQASCDNFGWEDNKLYGRAMRSKDVSFLILEQLDFTSWLVSN